MRRVLAPIAESISLQSITLESLKYLSLGFFERSRKETGSNGGEYDDRGPESGEKASDVSSGVCGGVWDVTIKRPGSYSSDLLEEESSPSPMLRLAGFSFVVGTTLTCSRCSSRNVANRARMKSSSSGCEESVFDIHGENCSSASAPRRTLPRRDHDAFVDQYRIHARRCMRNMISSDAPKHAMEKPRRSSRNIT